MNESDEGNNSVSVPITVMRDIIDFQDQALGSYPDDNVNNMLPGTERPV